MLITTSSLVVLVAGSVVGDVVVGKKLGRIVDIEIMKIDHTILLLALGGGVMEVVMEVVMESQRRKGDELRRRYRHGESGGRRAGLVDHPGSDLLIEVGPQGRDRCCGSSGGADGSGDGIDSHTIRGESSGGDRAAHHGSALFRQKEIIMVNVVLLMLMM